jgi:hypothetical protein
LNEVFTYAQKPPKRPILEFFNEQKEIDKKYIGFLRKRIFVRGFLERTLFQLTRKNPPIVLL